MKTLIPLLLLFLYPTFVCGDVKAVINGPNNANAGDLVVLTTTGSTGDNFLWILPESLQVLTCDANQQLAFASGKEGTFSFTLIAADKTAAIDYITHTIVIGKTLPPVPDPIPTPIPADDLTKISKESAPDDKETAKLLTDYINQTIINIDTLCATNKCPSLEEGKNLYQLAISNALGVRPRGTQSNWLIWREALEKSIPTPNDIQHLKSIMQAIIAGIK